MKKVYVLLENYFNGAYWAEDQESYSEKYVGVFPTWQKARDKITQIREEQVEEAKIDPVLLPSPIKEKYGDFQWERVGWHSEQHSWTEEWSYEIREDEYEEG